MKKQSKSKVNKVLKNLKDTLNVEKIDSNEKVDVEKIFADVVTQVIKAVSVMNDFQVIASMISVEEEASSSGIRCTKEDIVKHENGIRLDEEGFNKLIKIMALSEEMKDRNLGKIEMDLMRVALSRVDKEYEEGERWKSDVEAPDRLQ